MAASHRQGSGETRCDPDSSPGIPVFGLRLSTPAEGLFQAVHLHGKAVAAPLLATIPSGQPIRQFVPGGEFPYGQVPNASSVASDPPCMGGTGSQACEPGRQLPATATHREKEKSAFPESRRLAARRGIKRPTREDGLTFQERLDSFARFDGTDQPRGSGRSVTRPRQRARCALRMSTDASRFQSDAGMFVP